MKRIIRHSLFFLFMMIMNFSCEGLLEDCKTCKLITIIDGDRNEGPGIIYCGDKLEEKENMGTFEIGGNLSFYECE